MPTLPPRYAFRQENLRHWHLVEAACPVCRHRAVSDHAPLINGRPNHTRLVDLEANLRCQQCGRRGGHSLTVRVRPRDGPIDRRYNAMPIAGREVGLNGEDNEGDWRMPLRAYHL